jgi:NAD(P)-dependent dehydrogenase (short-subunit alcohol dehydrogenase family)
MGVIDTTTRKRVAIVTGSSSGIGLETALYLAENDFMTYATMRNPNKASDILKPAQLKGLPLKVLHLDVTDDTSVNQAIHYIEKNENRIDLLVNNAGYTQFGAAEDLSPEEIQAQFDTNVFGIFRTIREVIPIMRRQVEDGGGTIINIGSANGFFGVPCASAYVSSKFALEGLTQSLRYELAPFGIKVVLIEPGAIRTNIATNSMFLPKKIKEQKQQYQPNNSSSYEEMTKSIMEKSKAAVANGSPPKVVSDIVLEAVMTEKPQWRYLAGADAERLFETKTKMNDIEFEKFLHNLLGL